MLLAMLTGKLLVSKPYISHNKVPVVKTVYIDRDMPDVSFVFMVLMAWGTNEMVVPKAASSPSKVTKFINKTIFGFFPRFIVTLENYSIPMNPNIQNQQERLAQTFRQIDNQILQESKVAFLKIQSWQFAMRTPEIGPSYLREAAAMLKQSLLSFVPNTFVLSEEGYYLNPVEN
jgi:hypothetical protein